MGLVSNPRPIMVRAKVPWMSSHDLTHRAQEMQRLLSNTKKRIRIVTKVGSLGSSRIADRADAMVERQLAQGVRYVGSIWLLRKIQFDNVAPMPAEPLVLRPDHHAVLNRRGAGSYCSGEAVNLAKAQTAGPERLEVPRRAQPRNLNSRVVGRLINRVTRRRVNDAIIYVQFQHTGPLFMS